MPKKLPITNKNPAVLAALAKGALLAAEQKQQALAAGIGTSAWGGMKTQGFRLGWPVAEKIAKFLDGQYSAQQILDMDGYGVKMPAVGTPPHPQKTPAWATNSHYFGERKDAPHPPTTVSKPTGQQLYCGGCTHNHRGRCDKTLLLAVNWCAGYDATGGWQ